MPASVQCAPTWLQLPACLPAWHHPPSRLETGRHPLFPAALASLNFPGHEAQREARSRQRGPAKATLLLMVPTLWNQTLPPRAL